jgi:hypothetical protein
MAVAPNEMSDGFMTDSSPAASVASSNAVSGSSPNGAVTASIAPSEMSDGAMLGPAGAQPEAPAQPTGTPDQWLGFLNGVRQPLDNAGAWLGNAAQAVGFRPGADDAALEKALGAPKTTAQMLADAAAKGRTPGAAGKMAGQVVGTLPAFAITKNPFIGGALAGAASSDDPNNLQQVATNAGIGGLAGAAGGLATRALGNAIAPVLSPAVQKLKDMGVQMTSGQLLGGFPKYIEDTASDIPIVRQLVKGATDASMFSFNRAVVNQSLAPIGEALPDAIQTGHDAINYAANRLGAVFDGAMKSVGPIGHVDDPLMDAFDAARQTVKDAGPAVEQKLHSILHNNFWSNVNTDDSISAGAMQHANNQLGTLARLYSRGDPSDQLLGSGLHAAVDGLHDWVGRLAPEAAPALSAARTGWANLVRIEGAAGKGVDGVFSPANLMQAVRAADSSPMVAGSRQAIAKGHALLQDVAAAGQKVLPNKVPQSGTVPRGLMAAAVLGLPGAGAAALAGPAGWLGLGAGALVGSQYIPVVQGALRGLLAAERPAAARAVGAGVRALAPAASAIGSAAGSLWSGTQGLFGQPPGQHP